MNKESLKSKELRMALKIISGRQDISRFVEYGDLELFGWDVTKFSYYSKPTDDLVKERAEEILLEYLVGLKEDENKDFEDEPAEQPGAGQY